MATIRQRLADALMGDEKRKLQEAYSLIYDAYLEGPYQLPPEMLIQQLQEMDSAVLYDMVQNLLYGKIGSFSYGKDTEAERVRAVDESRRAFRVDVLTQWIIWLWTNFGFGEQIQVLPEDAGAAAWWDEFWTADRNAPVLAADELQKLSETVLKDGETFLTYFFALDGLATLRTIDTKEIVEIITHPEDAAVPLWYKRMWIEGSVTKTMYYPDWRAFVNSSVEKKSGARILNTDLLPKDALNANSMQALTNVCVQHVAHNRKEGIRGWPLMTVGLPWSRTHRRFREDRAAVAAAVAMFVNKLKIKGGSRAVETMRTKLGSALSSTRYNEINPPPVAGSPFIQNEAADLERMPLTTGAGDAKADGEALLLMVGLGGGVYPHWLGAGDAYRLATATSMEGPMLREFSRYRNFWSEQFRKMLRIVITGAGKKSGISAEGNLAEACRRTSVKRYRFTEAAKSGKGGEAEVSTDRLVEIDLSMISTAIASLYRDVLNPMVIADPATLNAYKAITAAVIRLALQALGVDEAAVIASDEAFMVGVEPEPPEPVVPPEGQGGGEPPEEEPEEAGMAEGINPDTGKVEPKGLPLPEWEGDVDITAEDVKVAVRKWDAWMGSDFAGMLDAPVKKEKET